MANADTYSATEDQPLIVNAPGVLGNDSDPDGNPITAVLVAGPTNGVLVLNPNGSFTYTPNPNATGPDSFTYFATDGASNSVPVTVVLNVAPVNDAPVANAQSVSLSEDSPRSITLTGSDVENSPLTFSIVSPPTNGVISGFNPNTGVLLYTPNTNFFGADAFTFRVNDGSTNSAPATVSLTVTPVNDAPLALNDTYAALQNQVLSVAVPVGVLANDSDVENNPLSAVLVTGPANGVLVLNPNGSFTYRPNTNFNGTDSFTYRASDGTASSSIATVTLNVAAENQPPVVQIAFPTNGSFFFVFQSIPITATAVDLDGEVTNVTILAGTNVIGATNMAPFSIQWSNMATGAHTLRAFAVDNLNARATSAPVNITVLSAIPVVSGVAAFNPQVNLFEQVLRVENPTPLPLTAVRVLIRGIPAGARLVNATGTNAQGVPFIQFNNTLAAVSSTNLTLEYVTPDRRVAPLTFTAEPTPLLPPPPLMAGTLVPISRVTVAPDGRVLIGFDSIVGRTYFIEYSDDMLTWKSAVPGVVAVGIVTQWIDNGPPKTETFPQSMMCRFYRVRLIE